MLSDEGGRYRQIIMNYIFSDNDTDTAMHSKFTVSSYLVLLKQSLIYSSRPPPLPVCLSCLKTVYPDMAKTECGEFDINHVSDRHRKSRLESEVYRFNRSWKWCSEHSVPIDPEARIPQDLHDLQFGLRDSRVVPATSDGKYCTILPVPFVCFVPLDAEKIHIHPSRPRVEVNIPSKE